MAQTDQADLAGRADGPVVDGGGTAEDPRAHPAPLVAVRILESEISEAVFIWEELCRWDPLLPPESRPPMAADVIRSVALALRHPQPLGWGPDPDIEPVAEAFAVAAGSLDVAVGQLICLREALRSHVEGRVPPEEQMETLLRMTMVVDRAIGVAARRMSTRLEEEAHVDALTGLLNRRALQRDIERDLGRAKRHSRCLTVVVADMDKLKAVNDRDGHAAGDRLLRELAAGLGSALRVGDQAYRVGGDEFVVLLPEATADTAECVVARVEAAGAPSFTWGSATYPDDGDDGEYLLDLADHRLLDAKRRR
ncbi:MAG TPA: GGDEF domain-containing protein [Acidimicrobiales bacterium]|nr:GGDEF domain-containing protein [Acidimicrobiales bacterium]